MTYNVLSEMLNPLYLSIGNLAILHPHPFHPYVAVIALAAVDLNLSGM